MSKVLHISKHIPSALQGSFLFPVPAISLTVEHPLESKLLRALLIVLALLLCGYLYFVSVCILNVMARKEASVHAASVQNAIASLEEEYFALSESVTEVRGASLGLHPIRKTSYVYRPGNTALAGQAAVTMGRNEI